MAEPETDPDRFLHIKRFNVVIGVAVSAVGLTLLILAKRFQGSLVWEVAGEIGTALLIAGIIELILFTGIAQLKEMLTKDARLLAGIDEQMKRSSARADEALNSVSAAMEHVRRRSHEIEVETLLKVMEPKLEAIHRAADPRYRQFVEDFEKKNKSSGAEPSGGQ